MIKTDNQSNRQQIVRAAAIVMTAFLVSRVVGVARDIVVTYYFGVVSIEATAYFTASRFPELIYYVIAGGALGSAFIPTFTEYFVNEDEAGGWALFAGVINLVLIATTLTAFITALFATPLVNWFIGDLAVEQPELLPMTVSLLRVMLLTPIIFGASGVIMGALNARQHFLLPAIAPIIYNLGIIAGAVFFAPNVMGLAWGTVLGAVGHLLIQLPALSRLDGRYQWRLTLADPGIRQVLRLMGPRVLGLSFGQLNHLITTHLAQFMVLGSIPALGYAWRIMLMPQAILGQAIGIAAFPTFAAMAARRAFDEMRQIVAETLRLILFIGIPATALLLILRRPLVQIFFERGEFDAVATDMVAWALLFYSFGLIALTLLELISRAFYALKDTHTPVIAGFIQLILMGMLGMWFSQELFPNYDWPAFGGLALAVSISNLIEVFVLLWLLRRKLGGLNGRFLLDGLFKMSAAASFLLLGAHFSFNALQQQAPILQLILPSLAGGILYLAAAKLFNLPELNQLLRPFLRRRKA